MMEMVDGSKANKSGEKLEKKIECIYMNLFPNIEIISRERFIGRKKIPTDAKTLSKMAQSVIFDKPTLIRNEYYEKSLTGKLGYVDFRFVYGNVDITIEAKNQDVAGSVEEKYDAIMLRILLNKYQSNIVWIVLQGKECEKFYSTYKKVFENAVDYLNDNGLALNLELQNILRNKEIKVLMVDELRDNLIRIFGKKLETNTL
jgi:hypothetical protein